RSIPSLRLRRGGALGPTYKAFPPQSKEIEHELRGRDEQNDDEDQRDGSSPQRLEAPPRSDIRADEDDGHQNWNEDELSRPREASRPEREIDHVRDETHRGGRDDEQRRSPDRLPGPPAEHMPQPGHGQQAASEPHAP